MLLAHVDAGVGPLIAIRYPTLRMHVHDGQLFGLHGVDETGRCVDQKLTRELCAHRPIGFGAPTAKTSAARGCGQVDSSSWRSNRPAGRGQRCALPTARASAHLTTAFQHDVQVTLLRELTALLLQDTRRHRAYAPNPDLLDATWLRRALVLIALILALNMASTNGVLLRRAALQPPKRAPAWAQWSMPAVALHRPVLAEGIGCLRTRKEPGHSTERPLLKLGRHCAVFTRAKKRTLPPAQTGQQETIRCGQPSR
jgi:hypothetical protein